MPASATSRSSPMTTHRWPPASLTAPPANATNAGPYGAGVCRQISDMESSHGHGSVAGPTAYGSSPAAYTAPWQAYAYTSRLPSGGARASRAGHQPSRVYNQTTGRPAPPATNPPD